MNTAQLTKRPPPPPSAGHQRRETPNAPPFDSEPPSLEERLDEILPLVGVVPVAGPPVIFLVVPWVLFALMLTGPFLLLVTFVLAGVILVVITAAIVAPLYLLIRHLRKHSARRPERHTPAHRSRELRPIGVSFLTQRSDAQLFLGTPDQAPAGAHRHNPYTPTSHRRDHESESAPPAD